MPKLIVFTAPSGAGKTTLVRHLLSVCDDLRFSVSATTRPIRTGETDGKDYYFIDKEEFIHRRQQAHFLEWEEVYDGNYYGTLKSEIDRIFAMGKSVIFDVDVEGAKNIKREYNDLALTIFVKPPSVETLRRRLVGRGSETDATLLQRLDKAIQELECEPLFDICLLNDDLNTAKQRALDIVRDFLYPKNLSNNENIPTGEEFSRLILES